MLKLDLDDQGYMLHVTDCMFSCIYALNDVSKLKVCGSLGYCDRVDLLEAVELVANHVYRSPHVESGNQS